MRTNRNRLHNPVIPAINFKGRYKGLQDIVGSLDEFVFHSSLFATGIWGIRARNQASEGFTEYQRS